MDEGDPDGTDGTSGILRSSPRCRAIHPNGGLQAPGSVVRQTLDPKLHRPHAFWRSHHGGCRGGLSCHRDGSVAFLCLWTGGAGGVQPTVRYPRHDVLHPSGMRPSSAVRRVFPASRGYAGDPACHVPPAYRCVAPSSRWRDLPHVGRISETPAVDCFRVGSRHPVVPRERGAQAVLGRDGRGAPECGGG